MFDYRYHAISLAAVLLALGIGLLLGVAIGDQGLVSRAEQGVRGNLREEVSEARAEVREINDTLETRQSYEQMTLPLLVADRLRGRRVAVLLLHKPSSESYEAVREVVRDAGGNVSSVSSLRLPLELERLGEHLASTRFRKLTEEPELVESFGRRIGVQLIEGGGLLRSSQQELFSSTSGSLEGADAVVLIRESPGEVVTEESEREEVFVDGVVAGVEGLKTPVLGVEVSETQPSQVPWYGDRGIGSVDSVDLPSGRAAVVFALAGSADGAYGIKPTSDALLPETVVREP
ncbi:MAG: copper transporter [Actinomycetota bacterium]|nr:copper transporter [Actinomycetota bacterium]